jgi:hypothetical protein
MRKSWKTVLIFSLVGLLIAGAVYLNSVSYDYSKPMSVTQSVLSIATFVLCPPTLLFVMCIDCEVDGRGGLIMFSIIGLLNAALYGFVGSLVVARKRKSN